MSDYLTRLMERSLGLAPQIEPLIAPIHAPSGQMLSETLETSATIESGPVPKPLVAPIHAPTGLVLSETVETPAVFELGPVAKIGTSEQEASPGAVVNVRGAEPAFSRAENEPPLPSTPRAVARAEFPVEKKDDRPDPVESRPKVRSRQTPSVSRPEALDITGASPPTPAPLSHATRIVSKEKNQIVVQPEVVNHVKLATTPAVSSPQPSPKQPPVIHVSRPAPPVSRPETSPPTPRPILGTTEMVSKEKNQIVVQPEVVNHVKLATTPAVSLLQPSPKEPPSIHVTIGRVEVRALMPRVAAPKPAPLSGPKLSLEDYLKQRNGGRS